MFFKRLTSVIVSMVIALFCGGTSKPPAKPVEPIKYPFVMVHGMGGWGNTSNINDKISYWGATTGNAIDYLNEQGFDCYAASVGPFSSAWDRACELYAQLVGTTVDYGAAHSEKYGHKRYGRTYEEPLFEGWGQKDIKGNVKKVNLYGHSFGGATVRMLTYLLANGCNEEQLKSASLGAEVSPLFTGGKGNLVFSVTTVASPHNGATLMYTITDAALNSLVNFFCLSAATIGSSSANDIVDMQLEQFGFSKKDGRINLTVEKISELSKTEDNVFHDLTLDGAEHLNSQISTVDGVYYFSFAVCGTVEDNATGYQVPTADMMSILWMPAKLIGKYSVNNKTDYVINGDWLPNDGLVNTISASAPFFEKSVDYIEGREVKGIWQKMPIVKGDHGSVIGLMASSDKTHTFFTEHMHMINNLK